jgi:tRNA threonylcarbamoyladenosine biosynthesis protein TsaE
MSKRAQLVETSHQQWPIILRSARDTTRLGQIIGQAVIGGEVLALYGLVGAGKTTLVRGIAQGLGAAPHLVVSPTFTLVHVYQGRLSLIHTDLYRIRAEHELLDLGLDEYLDGEAVMAIEWPDRAPNALPEDRLEVHLEHRTARTRHALFTATGSVANTLLRAIRTEYKITPGRTRNHSHVPVPAATARRRSL